MSLTLVKVTPSLAARIEADPELLDQVWPEMDDEPVEVDPEIAAIDEDRDTFLEDFRGIFEEVEQEPGRYPWMRRALQGTGREVSYDFGYGDGFVVTAKEAAEIADGLAAEGWWSAGQEVTLIPHGIAAFYRAAADEGRTIIGGVS